MSHNCVATTKLFLTKVFIYFTFKENKSEKKGNKFNFVKNRSKIEINKWMRQIVILIKCQRREW